MSQSDYNIENADGATVRADINSQLEAIGSTNSGSTAPSVTFPYMRWHDTANSQLKERNGANTAWIVVADIVAGELVPHAGGAQVPQISGGADANFTAMPQVGGDAVVESGSNSDGEWTRWADGTQLVRSITADGVLDITTASGNIFTSSVVSLNYPQPFTEAYAAFGGDALSANVWAGTRAGSTTGSVTLMFHSSLSGRTGVVATYGSWK